MKLQRVEISGFRGAPVPLELRLGEKSLCLLAENGHGKTTIVDGLELWSSGDIRHYHREGYELDSVVNLDSQWATVTVETSLHPPLTRTLIVDKPSALQPSGPIAVDAAMPGPLPILRHRTMAEFMDMSPGKKKSVLLELLGLSGLTEFRQTLRSAATSAERTAKDAQRQAHAEGEALDVLRAGRDLLELAEELRCAAGLAHAIRMSSDLLGLAIEEPSSTEPDRPGLVAALARVLAEASDNVTTDWNAAIEDRTLVAAGSLSALVAAGRRVLGDWAEATCPLCLQPKDRDELLNELTRRAAELESADRRLRELATELASYSGRIDSLDAALGNVIAAAPPEGWPETSKLDDARAALREHRAAVDAARQSRTPCPAPVLDLPDLAKLEAAAAGSVTAGGRTRAVADLVRLRDQAARVCAAEARSAASTSVAAGVDALLTITDARIRGSIEDAIARIGALAADYYGRLVATPVYRDVTLEYRTARSGGIEFSLVFDGRHSVTPPQRVMSESQLNALGLALFLAQLKVNPQSWSALVLDDVVNSFDANHRVGLARLLAEEFSDWQVLLVTHDRVFATLARKLMPGWRFSQIAAWTPQGGPVIEDGDARELLRVRLAEGRSAAELGGLARVALEQGLSLPLEKLGLEIRFDPLGRHSAHEYLVALRRGLRDRKANVAADALLARIEADSYLVNLGAHDRPADPALTVEELNRLVADLKELEETFVCTGCGDPAWTLARDAGRHHQCTCSALAV